MSARPSTLDRTHQDSSTLRILGIAAVIFAWMFIIAGRLIYLQMFQHDWLRERALDQQQSATDTSPQRGIVYDRQGKELARSIDTETIYIEPPRIEDVHSTALSLAPLIGQDRKQLEAKLQESKLSNKKSILLARKLDSDQASRIHSLNIPGVYSLKEPKRIYPNGSLAAHILGFVGLDNVGLGGVEKVFNERIKGEGGKLYVQTDGAQNRNAYASFETPSTAGQNVYLTIDQLIQFRTEQALNNAVKNSRAKSGTAIVLDPRTGEILALANAPSFDPNKPEAVKDEMRANQALQNVYEPGSTFKIVAYAAAIEQKLVRPDDLIDCQMGAITVAGRVIHDHKSFGTLSISEALEMSSNVAAIKLGLKVGNENMAEYISRFGFGRKTGVELPGETNGIVRPISRWQASSIGSIAIGQEIGVTPLQMAAAFAAVANDGVRITPHIVREIREPDGSVVFKANPKQYRVISAETAAALRGMLEGVTLNGTAKRAKLEGYSAAGKTGTAQKFDQKSKRYSATKFIGSFVGFAPVENPSVVIIVAIDEPKGAYHGGDVAAPVFREIAEQVLPDMNVAPDAELLPTPTPGRIARVLPDPEKLERERLRLEREVEEQRATLPSSSPDTTSSGVNEIVYAPATNRGLVMPDLRGSSVRDAMRICAQLGLQLEARGDGRALRQDPSPGTELTRGQTVQIYFGRGD
jgi:cell division protein FtsI (penicillin-binding protein 3)